jgi:tRNA-specific 2-thiouridylase
MATGHYVRLSSNEYADTPRLLRGIDSSKDQSYFLSTTEVLLIRTYDMYDVFITMYLILYLNYVMQGRKFKDVIFPVGDMTKKQVRTIAESVFAGLRVLDKKESMGVCFIGKRDIGNFLSNYVNVRKDMRCRFIDVTDGKVLEDNITNNTAMFYTLGQGAKIGGKPMKYFVVSKLISNCFCDIYVAPGSNHPSLYSNTVEIPLSRFNWISGNIPIDMFNHTVTSTSDSASWCVEDSNNEGISMVCECQFRHLQEPLKCRVRIVYKSFPMQHFQNDKKLSPLGVKYLKENSHINTRRQFEGMQSSL